jgi:hypothetical protein
MRYILFFLLLLSVNAWAYIDSDMDGVEDRVDQCPNTSLTELVDIRGCTITSVLSEHHYDIIVGGSYTREDFSGLDKTDTLTTSVQVDYYYKNFSLQASTSYFSSDSDSYSDDGLNDSVIAGYYQFRPSEELYVRIGLGTILPTYDSNLNNNNTDYFASLNLSYSLNKFNIFGGYMRTLINDDDVGSIEYTDTNGYNLGLGYYFNEKLYMSMSYNTTESIYTGVDNLETASWYAFYSIDKHWFTTFSYAYGLSDTASEQYLGARLGYYF